MTCSHFPVSVRVLSFFGTNLHMSVYCLPTYFIVVRNMYICHFSFNIYFTVNQQQKQTSEDTFCCNPLTFHALFNRYCQQTVYLPISRQLFVRKLLFLYAACVHKADVSLFTASVPCKSPVELREIPEYFTSSSCRPSTTLHNSSC